MAKSNYNVNAMRPLLVRAHNSGNSKAINKDMCDGAGIDHCYLIKWQADVEDLYNACKKYNEAKYNSRMLGSEITETEVTTLRNRIYPKLKTLLESGEKDKIHKELHAEENDVEELVCFQWDFFATSHGTVRAGVKLDKFRQKVESMIGCKMAKNAFMTAEDREVIDTYKSALKRLDTTRKTQKELAGTIEMWEGVKDGLKPEEVTMLAYCEKMVNEATASLKAEQESELKAQQTVDEHEGKVNAINARIKLLQL